METDFKENSKITKEVKKEYFIMQMETYIVESLKEIRRM
jgi:hypothetical protein